MRSPSRRFVLLLLPLLALSWIAGPFAGTDVGEAATDFSLEPVGGGKAVHLSDFRGKPVLVVFWATWCPPCRREIPVLKKLHETYGPRGLEIVGVAIPYRQTRDAVIQFEGKYELPYVNLWDTDSRTAGAYDISHVPTNVLVDPDGVIRLRKAYLSPEFEDFIIRYTKKKA